MSFNPLRNSTTTVDATTTPSSQIDTPSYSNPNGLGGTLYPSVCLLYNSGAGLAFVDKFAGGDTPGASPTASLPLPPNTVMALTCGKDVSFQLVSASTSKIYVSFGDGDISGFVTV